MPEVKLMNKPSPKHVEDRRSFISDAFHSFHQPLTALHCGLELSLLKQRDAADYQKRLHDALVSAGAILQLNKALRELVEATDPGENFGPVELKPLLSKLAEELSYAADPGLVAVRMSCPSHVFVGADPNQLLRHLGNLGSILIRPAELGSTLQIKAHCDETLALLKFNLDGVRRECAEKDLPAKLEQMRFDAACSYMWTIGAEFRKTKRGFAIALPTLH